MLWPPFCQIDITHAMSRGPFAESATFYQRMESIEGRPIKLVGPRFQTRIDPSSSITEALIKTCTEAVAYHSR